MVNTNIQANVILNGPGLRYKDYGPYEPGEYKTLKNVEVTENGSLRTRRDISQPTTGGADYDRVHRFIGTVDNFAWATNDASIFPVGESGYAGPLPDSPANLPDQAGNHYHHVVGFFKYNNLYYWITANYDGTNVKFYVYSSADIGATFASMDASKTLVTTVKAQGRDLDAYQHAFKSFFIFKDRLFIVTHEGVWFSKATDPKVYTVPEGGFFKIPDQELNAVVAVSDSVYLATNKAIHVFTYSVDPNEDGYMRPLTSDLGAWSMVVNGGQVFASNKYSLFTLTQGGSPTRIIDFEQIKKPVDGVRNKLVSFENYIIVIEYRMKDVPNEAYALPVGYRSAADAPNSILAINANNGAIHEIDFEDYVSTGNTWQRGRIIDAILTKPTYDDDPTLVFMTSRAVDPATADYDNSFYIMDYPREGNSTGVDRIRDLLGNRFVKINQIVEIDSVVPDGNELLMKKFRNIMGMAQLPASQFEMAIAYENRIPTNIASLDSSGVNELAERPPHPFRFRINQRARSITIIFRSKNVNEVSSLQMPKHLFELSDLKLFWTYTQLAPVTRDNAK